MRLTPEPHDNRSQEYAQLLSDPVKPTSESVSLKSREESYKFKYELKSKIKSAIQKNVCKTFGVDFIDDTKKEPSKKQSIDTCTYGDKNNKPINPYYDDYLDPCNYYIFGVDNVEYTLSPTNDLTPIEMYHLIMIIKHYFNNKYCHPDLKKLAHTINTDQKIGRHFKRRTINPLKQD